MEKIKSLSVVIPAYNEEKIIKESISSLDDTLKTIAEDYEIIVVDDKSTDNTAEILKNLSSSLVRLKVIYSESNRKLGSTLRKGFSLASKELIFYTDADMPIDYFEIYRAFEILKNTASDLVLGFRRNRGDESTLRAVCSVMYNWLVRAVFGIKWKDINFSCKLIKKSVLDKLNLKSEGSFIDAEMVAKAEYMGYAIKEIGVNYFSRRQGPSHLFRMGVILCILSEMTKYYREIRALRSGG